MVTTDLSYAWNDAYSVGIQEVDEQHKVLLQLLDALHRAIRAGQGAESLKVLNQLVEYTRHHFTMEESLMRVTNYPDFGSHKELHQNLMAQIHKVQDELAGGQLDLDGEMLQFVKIWLIQHINETDRRFGQFFHGTGLEPQWSPAVAEAMGKKKWWWQFW